MNDIGEIRCVYRGQEIDNVGWIRSQHNNADPLTGRGKQIIIIEAL